MQGLLLKGGIGWVKPRVGNSAPLPLYISRMKMTNEQLEAIYHVARTAFIAGQDEVPWTMVLHTIRNAFDSEPEMNKEHKKRGAKLYKITEKDYRNHPQLTELERFLQASKEACNAQLR
jgi:hypothetical protein